MNISVNIECSPEEARRMMGLPDLGPIHDIYLDRLRGMIAEGVTPESVDRMMRAWSPVGEAGMAAWRQLMDRMVGGAGS